MQLPDRTTRILVAYDGSEQSLRALAWTSRFVRPEVTVISVVQTLAGAERIADAVEPGVNVHADRLQAELDQLRQLGVVTSVFVAAGNPAEEIVRAAEAGGFDLVVVGSLGLNAIERFFLGAVAERVARHAPCPVLVVR